MQFDNYIKKARENFNDVEKSIADFNFSTGDQKVYEKLNREYQQLRKLLESWDNCQKAYQQLADNKELLDMEEDEEFCEVIQADIDELKKVVSTLERKIKIFIVPPHPNQGKPVIVEIRPAAGGDEAGLFASDIHRMYMRFADHKKWKVDTLEFSEKELGGLKNAVFSLQGSDVHDYMIHESGVHRVQRIPTTESNGRVHTSTITVAVLSEAEEVDIKINTEDLRFDTYRASGAGGQHVNTTDSAVRVTHKPSGIVCYSSQEKSQHRNKEIALRLLRAKMLEIKQAEEDAKNADARRQQVGTGDRSERIRTYNYPQNRISDHRFGITTYDLTNILEGNLQDFFDEIITVYSEQQLAKVIEE